MARGLGSWVTAGSQLCNISSECVCGQPVLKQPKMPIYLLLYSIAICLDAGYVLFYF